MLLPHGYEGQGAEHSSGRMERFLQNCTSENMQVANCTTPANLFHLLRRQMKRNFRKPLIVFTPKSLLRHPLCISPLEDFAKGSFQEIIDQNNPSTEKTERVLLCSGKIYYELLTKRQETGDDKTAIVRLEQLNPLPYKKLSALVAKYAKVKSWTWVQEEPENMGAWTHLLRLWKEVKLDLIARHASGTPATGSHDRHDLIQEILMERAFKSTTKNLVTEKA
jgi:2-oxoglutarate dehydrogenase E1 component